MAFTMGGSLVVAVESARTAEAHRLLRAAEAELCVRYPDYECPVFAPEAVEMRGAAFFVARLGGDAVGCLAIRPHSETIEAAELKRMWVSPDVRGQGIGRQLLAFAETWAKDTGYQFVLLETGVEQPEAMALYARLGYQCIPCWGEYADDAVSVCYEKTLVSG